MSIYTRVIDLQNLNRAWERVRKNKPAAGVDNITFAMFDENKKVELKQLNLELQQHMYEALPVRQVTLYKGEKARTIALYSMRDKVVQQSLAEVLTKMYDSQFSDQTVAYRPDRSALIAIGDIEKQILQYHYPYVLKVDIAHFFDCIRWTDLKNMLQQQIKEDDVLELIQWNSTTRYLEESGEIVEKTVGIHQGGLCGYRHNPPYAEKNLMWS